jgi:hypothetical protein
MKSLKFALVICMMFIVANMQAQVKFGPTVGLNLSTAIVKSGGTKMDTKSIVGFNVGLISEFNLTGNLFLQPALLFTTKGTKVSDVEFESTITPSFIEIPVNVVYKFGSESVKFFLNAGPYVAYGIGGKIKSGGESVKIKFGSGESDDMKPFDFGLTFGAGIELNNFIVSAHYGFGITNLSPVTTDNTEAKVRVIGFSVAYLFGGE